MGIIFGIALVGKKEERGRKNNGSLGFLLGISERNHNQKAK